MQSDKNVLVSIITVVYNGEKYLQQTIDSVKNQTYQNIEYIIIDGGSTDSTLDIIEKNKHYISHFVSEKDEGLYDAMNKGISLTGGELIGIINSDDWYELDAVENMIEAYINNSNKNIFHADRYDVLSSGQRKLKKFHPSSFKFKYYGMTYNHPSMFISKKEYELHKYDTKLRAYSDYQFVLEAFLRDSSTFFYLSKVVVNYRLDGLSGNMSFQSMIKEGFISRKNAGMSLIQNLLSVLVRSIVRFINKLRRGLLL